MMTYWECREKGRIYWEYHVALLSIENALKHFWILALPSVFIRSVNIKSEGIDKRLAIVQWTFPFHKSFFSAKSQVNVSRLYGHCIDHLVDCTVF